MVVSARSRSGNVVVYILVVIALFGALAYTFMRSSQTGQGSISSHQARLTAIEMIDQANRIERAVQKLLRNGCSEMELNFKHPSFPASPWLNNINARPDGDCDIYGPAGGVQPLFYPEVAGYYEDQPSGKYHRKLYLPIEAYMLDIGTNYKAGKPQEELNKSLDVFIAAQFTNRQVCEEISRMTGFSDTLVDVTEILNKNTLSTEGKYGNLHQSILIRAYDPVFRGKTAGCFYQANPAITHMAFPRYIFFRVLIAR